MKYGINIKIDVTKLDRSKFFIGANGAKYCDMTVFMDTENLSQFGDNGMVTQAQTADERASGIKMPPLGNVKKFWEGPSQAQQQPPQQQAPQQQYQQAPQQQAPQQPYQQAPTQAYQQAPQQQAPQQQAPQQPQQQAGHPQYQTAPQQPQQQAASQDFDDDIPF